MADEKNQNDAVQDLLARLRSQMSQLDEKFGTASSADVPSEDEPSSPTEASETENITEEPPAEEAPVEEAPLEEASSAEEDLPEEALEEETAPPFAEEEEPPAVEEAPAPLKTEKPEQIDFLAAFVEETAEEEEPTAPEDTPEADAPVDDGDEIPVFVREEAPIHVRKERIVAEESLISVEEDDREAAVTVTEVETAPPTPAAPVEEDGALFVPNRVDVEEHTPASTSPFAPERRFDPSRYDEMLRAYEEKRAAQAELPHEEPSPTTEPKPALPRTPVLMPVETASVKTVAEEAPPTVAEEENETPDAPSEELFAESVAQEDEPLLTEKDAADEVEEAPTDAEEPLPAEEEAPAVSPIEPVPEPMPVEPIEAPPEVPPTESVEPTSEPASDPASEQPMPARVRIRVADPALRDTARDARTNAPSGRILLAPRAYRMDDDYVRDPKHAEREEEEDYMGELPEAIRDHLVGSPLGHPNRARKDRGKGAPAAKPKKKKKKLSKEFPEELEGKSINDFATDTIRHQLEQEMHQTRLRLLVIATLAVLLLFLENITFIPFVPENFVDSQTAGVLNAILLLSISLAAWPRMYAGVRGLFIGRVLPETVLLLETAVAFVYAVIFGVLGKDVVYFSSVPALGIAILYCFRTLHSETRRRSFEKLVVAGEKLVLSPVENERVTEALGATDDRRFGIYRVRKAAAVDGFSERSSRIVEDERINFVLLFASLGVGVAAFLITFFTIRSITLAIGAAIFACFFALPVLMMCSAHVYPMHRTDCAAGEDSAVVGEVTVEEATKTRAIAFEDVEAAPSAGVKLSGVRVYCDDPTTVFRYLTALYNHIGGPLCGRFSGMYVNRNAASTALVELVDATKDGVSAAIDGAEILVGNGQYMTTFGIVPAYDAADERVLPDGKCGVLYVAVNGMICMKFYIEHTISPEFEHNVKRLYRRHIVAILRTYDPNFNDKTISNFPSLRDSSVHVISKKKEERADFYAERAKSGIVTSSGTTVKLLSLLLLTFRTRRALRFGRVYKIVAAVLGGAFSILLAALGLCGFIPSVCIALYQLVVLGVFMLYIRLSIKRPDITKEK